MAFGAMLTAIESRRRPSYSEISALRRLFEMERLAAKIGGD